MLPTSALKIDDFATKSGELLPLSSSAFRCCDLEKGRIPLDSETTQDEINKYYNSSGGNSKKNGIWGFFFDSVENEHAYKPVFDESGKLIRSEKLEFSLVRGDSITASDDFITASGGDSNGNITKLIDSSSAGVLPPVCTRTYI